MTQPSIPPTAQGDAFSLASADSTTAARLLSARIRAEGPITFADFMGTALYDTTAGYYRGGRPTVGREGDFLTSPELHPLFGYAVGALAFSHWKAGGGPGRYALCDVGPGSGALIDAAFAWASAQQPDFARALRGVLVEPGRAARERQRERLAPIVDRLNWYESLDAVHPGRGLVVANELLDAQPVHRLRWDGSGWQELRVGLEGSRFVDVPSEPESPALLAPLRDLTPSPGQIVEICAGVETLIGGLASALEEGLLLLFDYGDRRERRYASWRSQGTLMTFHRHTPADDPYVRVGEQDLTCHVDIDAVLEAGRAEGLHAYPVRSQAEWLATIGATSLSPLAEAGSGAALDAHLERRRAAQLLSDPAGLGRIQVMAFAKGSPANIPSLGESP